LTSVQFQQQEQQQRGVTRKWQRKKRLQQPQLQQQHQQQQQQRQQRWRLSMHASTAVACPNVRSAHEARMKEHLLNIKICGFLSSTAAAECPAEEVQSKLKSLSQSSSSTTRNFNFLTEAFKVWTVPYAVPYFTVYTV
jgi:hypothetical protein